MFLSLPTNPRGRWLCKEMIGLVRKRKLCLIREFSPCGLSASYMLFKPNRKGLTFGNDTFQS